MADTGNILFSHNIKVTVSTRRTIRGMVDLHFAMQDLDKEGKKFDKGKPHIQSLLSPH